MAKAIWESQLIMNSVFIADRPQRYERVFKMDILYAQAEGAWVDVVTAKKTYNLSTNLGTIEPQLDPAYFLRVSRKHVINVHRVEAIQGNLLLVAGHQILMGRQFRTALLERLPILKTKFLVGTNAIPAGFGAAQTADK